MGVPGVEGYDIALLIGSLRRDSLNRRLAIAVQRLAPPELRFREVPIGELPLYNQDNDAAPAEAVRRFKDGIASAQGLLFVTPEYNRSIPGVLKNAIDQGSRPAGRSSWGGKPAGILGATPGALGTALAQQHLRGVLAALDVRAMAQPDAYLQVRDGFFDEAGNVGAGSAKFLEGWMARFLAWVRQHAG
jgi:chromate reductase